MPKVHHVLEPFVLQAGSVSVKHNAQRIKLAIDEQLQYISSSAAYSKLVSRLADSGIDLLNFDSYQSRDIKRYRIVGLSTLSCLLDINDEVSSCPHPYPYLCRGVRLVLTVPLLLPLLLTLTLALILTPTILGCRHRQVNPDRRMQMGDQFIRVLENDRQVLHIVSSHLNLTRTPH